MSRQPWRSWAGRSTVTPVSTTVSGSAAHKGLALDHTTEAAVLAGSHQPNPATGSLFLALGVIYYERNRLDLAQQCLEKALELCMQLGWKDYLFAVHAFLARTLGARGQSNSEIAHKLVIEANTVK